MSRENKKRMQPKHLLTAAVVSGLIPMEHIHLTELPPEDQKYLLDIKQKKSGTTGSTQF